MADKEIIPKGRAKTPKQKREVIERIFNAWLAAPDLRLGQLIDNARFYSNYKGGSTFYIEDKNLAEEIEDFLKGDKRL